MTGVPREIAEHHLKVDPNYPPVVQGKRGMGRDKSKDVCEEVTKLVKAGILREQKWHTWVANPVMVQKSDGSWRMCVDFTSLNKACPKDCYPLPAIDAKVDALSGYTYKCFLDAYKGYHQIKMAKADEEKTAFHTDKGIFCYRKMPFGLKNAGSTYQRLIDQAFDSQIGRNMEAYVDDLVIKSQTEEGMIADIEETFGRLRAVNMKLNPAKCSFGMKEGKFLGHIITEKNIMANPEKIRAITQMKPPQSLKELQCLNGRLAALHRFISKSAEKSMPFFRTLKQCTDTKQFLWTEEADIAFTELKEQLKNLATVTAPEAGEEVILYLSVGEEAISSVLCTERGEAQIPVYFVSRATKDPETRYSKLEKLLLSLIHTARRLRRYFQAYRITVLTNYPLREIVQRPETSGRFAKWAIELGEHELHFKPRTAIKGQVLADFLTELKADPSTPMSASAEYTLPPPITSNDAWTLYTDGAKNSEGSGAGLVLIDPNGVEVTYAILLDFPSTNNEAEYEALLAGLRLARKMNVKKLSVKVDSLLVTNQVNGEFEIRGEAMQKYASKVKEIASQFEEFQIIQIPRGQNKKADALSKLASLAYAHLTKQVPVEIIHNRTDEIQEAFITEQDTADSWMTPIKNYLQHGTLPTSSLEAAKLKAQADGYAIHNNKLYKKSYLQPLLTCLTTEEGNYIMRELHEGICGTHSGPRSIVTRMMTLGYYWPTMYTDTEKEIRKCQGCQMHASVQRVPKHNMIPVTSPWPFYKWGIDIVGPFPEAPGRIKFLIVAVDYFTKWPEVKAVATITDKQVVNFVWEQIVCRYGLPGKIVSDNGKQFADNPFRSWCRELQITQIFTSVAHPQANGQVERTNRSIVSGIKARLGKEGKGWLNELPSVIWAIRTTERTSHGHTPYSLTFGSEAVIPAEIGIPTFRIENVSEPTNDSELLVNLALTQERRDMAAINEAKYKKQMEGYYNQRVRTVTFRPGDYVFRNNEASRQEDQGKLGPTWEGPYQIMEAHAKGSYKLATMDGKPVPRHWNGMQLKKCYL
ncbi:hypothetical protein SSX86_001440 [Deinandra increscens subsp. villosa]|uniref:Uncharacterized protein n=1 Tax=Deinandra increscens subsp. villosa TaxID=3103831 RepID=A0AAP0HCL3_9ASTR